jgi:hypothetical protein
MANYQRRYRPPEFKDILKAGTAKLNEKKVLRRLRTALALRRALWAPLPPGRQFVGRQTTRMWTGQGDRLPDTPWQPGWPGKEGMR